VLGVADASVNDLNEILAAHHAAINAVQGRVSIATSLAQALTKRAWDATRQRGDFRVGEWVLVHVAAPNRLLPHFTGPYLVTSVTADNNFVQARHYLTPEGHVDGPFHVSRLLHFDMSRATTTEIAQYQLDAGSAIVDAVEGHRLLANGTFEFHIRWMGYPVTSWLAGAGLRRVTKVIDYCAAHGLPAPGTVLTAPASSAPVAGVRGRGGRGRGRGGRGTGRDCGHASAVDLR